MLPEWWLSNSGQVAQREPEYSGDLIDTIEYDYPAFHLSMDCFWCTIVGGNLTLLEAEDAKWLTKDTLRSVEWLPADLELIDRIEAVLG